MCNVYGKLLICTAAASVVHNQTPGCGHEAEEEELDAWWRRAKASWDLRGNSVPHYISPQWLSQSNDHCFTSAYQIPRKFLFWPTLFWNHTGEDSEDLGFQLNDVDKRKIQHNNTILQRVARCVSTVYCQEMPNIIRVQGRPQKLLVTIHIVSCSSPFRFTCRWYGRLYFIKMVIPIGLFNSMCPFYSVTYTTYTWVS